MGPPKFNFFFSFLLCDGHLWLAYHQKNYRALDSPEIEICCNISSFGAGYKGLESITDWELDENTVRMSWEHIGNNKNPITPPSPKEKKSLGHTQCDASPHQVQETFLCTLLPIYKLHASWTMAKQYGIKKMRCYWECLREHSENSMQSPWEHIGNKQTRNPSPPSLPPLKSK